MEAMDVEHLIETFKECIARAGFNVPAYIAKHNRKCNDHGYTKRKTA